MVLPSDPHHSSVCRANSVTWNPHKMMGVLLQCSAILVREKVSLCCLHGDLYSSECVSLFNVLFPAGDIRRLQLHVRGLPLPARQTV